MPAYAETTHSGTYYIHMQVPGEKVPNRMRQKHIFGDKIGSVRYHSKCRKRGARVLINSLVKAIKIHPSKRDKHDLHTSVHSLALHEVSTRNRKSALQNKATQRPKGKKNTDHMPLGPPFM